MGKLIQAKSDKRKVEIIGDVYRIVSEPGDRTHYDYLMFVEDNLFRFIPYQNTFPYPTKIYASDVLNIDCKYIYDNPPTMASEDQIKNIAKEYGCNPWTVLECVSVIQEYTKIK